MRAVQIEKFGDPATLQIHDVPQPRPNHGEVLVEIRAASINPSDAKNVQGAMKHTTLPRIPGRDFAGVVIDGDPALLGMEVWGTGGDLGFTRDGTHAQYIVLPKEAVQPKPKSLTMEQAASSGVTYITAWLCLMEAAKAQSGENVVVIGATGGVGSAAVQIAVWKGMHVIGTIRHDRDRQTLQQAGADVINSETEDLAAAVKTMTNNQGANVIIDTVGGEMVLKALSALAPSGRLTEITVPPKQQQVSIDLLDLYRRQLRIIGVNTLEWTAKNCAEILALLNPGFEAQALRVLGGIDKQNLEQAASAYEQVVNHSKNKVVLIPHSD